MTPITKNIRVVDEQGNEYEHTYPKRAIGLVKHGRARFVDENTICLACPPNDNMEDKIMSDTTNIKVNETTGEVIEETNSPTLCSLDYALRKLDEIQREMKEFSADMAKRIENALALIPDDDDDDDDDDEENDGRQEYSSAVDALKTISETTAANYCKLIDFYTAMAKEAKPHTPYGEKQQFLDFVTDCIGAAELGVKIPDFAEIWKMINS